MEQSKAGDRVDEYFDKIPRKSRKVSESAGTCYAFKSLEVREIVKSFLSVNGFDGLVDCYGECGCRLDDLFPCGDPNSSCLAAYKKTIKEDSALGSTWEMVQAPDSDIDRVKDPHKTTWIAAVHSTDRIFKETVRKGMRDLSPADFYKWIGGFVA